MKLLTKILTITGVLVLAGFCPARAEHAGEAAKTCMDKEVISYKLGSFLGPS